MRLEQTSEAVPAEIRISQATKMQTIPPVTIVGSTHVC